MTVAYQLGHRQELYELTEGRLVDLQVAVDQLWKYHRSLWHKSNKPFGWEVVEMRYGGLRTRLMTMRDRILEYIEASESWQQQQQQQQLQAVVDPGSASVGSQNSLNGLLQRRDSLPDGEDPRPSIPEFEAVREPMYEYAGCNLLMDYARVSTPTRPG
jgi:hypothetical protein